MMWLSLACLLGSAGREKMVRVCKFPNCSNKMTRHTPCSFHRLPLHDPRRLGLWLAALHIHPDTSVKDLRAADYRVCSEHFDREDYLHQVGSRTPKHYYLKPTAVPRAVKPEVKAEDNWAVMDRLPGHSRSTGVQVNLPETCTVTMKKPTPQHIVDEEAILQLMKNCPMCNRKCRCSKHTRGPYFIVYQSCYFCDYQRKWASQPEAKNINIHKAYTTPKKKLQPKDKVSANARARSSQLNKTRVSESHDTMET